MGNGSDKPPRLPDGAPAGLKDFVACTGDQVEVDTGKLDWVPKGPFGNLAPSPTVEAGTTPNTATIRMGPLALPASIGPTGELVVDTSGVPGFLGPVKSSIDNWTKAFNRTLQANKKKLTGFEISGAKAKLTKAPVAAAPTETPAATPQPETTQPAGGPTEDEAGDDKTGDDKAGDDKADNGGCKWPFAMMMLVLVAVIAAIVIAVVALTGGGGDDDAASNEVTTGSSVDEPELKTLPEPEAKEIEADPTGDDETDQDVDPTEEVTDPVDEVTEPVDDPAPSYPVGATFWAIDQLDDGQAYDVPSGESLGPFTFDGHVEFFVRDQPVNGGHPFMGVVSPVTNGALEGWQFDDESSNQTGDTVFFPTNTSFDTFGVVGGQGNSFACNGGAVFFGEFGSGDPRGQSSWGITGYWPLGPDDGYPEGSTGAAGAFLGGVDGTPFVFDVDPAGTITADSSASWIAACADDPDVATQMLNQTFFAPPDPADSPDDPFAGLDLGGIGGDVFLATRDEQLDSVDCADNETPVDNTANDIYGVIGMRDGGTVHVAVVMAESPLMSVQQNWSWNVTLQAVTERGEQGIYLNEMHDGGAIVGQLVDGAVEPGGVETRLTDDAVLFTFENDPADPLGIVAALSLNTREEGEHKACDEVFGDMEIFADGFESGDTSAWTTGP